MAKKAKNNHAATVTIPSFELLERSAAAAAESLEDTRERLRRQEMEGKSNRSERFEQARIWAAIWTLRLIVIAFGFLILMMFVAGFTNYLLETPGVLALRDLFVQIVISAKSIILVVIGYFFRDYVKKAL